MIKKIIIFIVIAMLFSGCTSEKEVIETENKTLPVEMKGLLAKGLDKLTVEESNKIENIYLDMLGFEIKEGAYNIVDTGQTQFYSDIGSISKQEVNDSLYGQDANYITNTPSYTDNGDGTITDNVTGLMWQKDPGEKKTWDEAFLDLEDFSLAGYTDWRLPTIKELYSLILFTGSNARTAEESVPYIDTKYFDFKYGDESIERFIDSQFATSTIYESDTMNNNPTMFGVNFADGRIKGYPITKTFYVMYVRGNKSYGLNKFINNNDGTISDLATGLMWSKYDSGYFDVGQIKDGGLNWQEALDWCKGLEVGGYSDWKLPDAKEMQSILDYSRSPDSTDSAAIDPIFSVSNITDLSGKKGFPYYWTSTTHLDGILKGGSAVYICFGESLGIMNGRILDVHGAGAQRSDLKIGSIDEYPKFSDLAPQGDDQRVYNYVRPVRYIDD